MMLNDLQFVKVRVMLLNVIIPCDITSFNGEFTQQYSIQDKKPNGQMSSILLIFIHSYIRDFKYIDIKIMHGWIMQIL